jgi:bleomycin hydrolase
MDQFVYQFVINKAYLSEDQLKAQAQDPIVLKPWDPMGALA